MPYAKACPACTQDAKKPQPTGHVRQQQADRHIPLDDKYVVDMISLKTSVDKAGFSRDDVLDVIRELGLKLYCCQECSRYRLTDPEQDRRRRAQSPSSRWGRRR